MHHTNNNDAGSPFTPSGVSFNVEYNLNTAVHTENADDALYDANTQRQTNLFHYCIVAAAFSNEIGTWTNVEMGGVRATILSLVRHNIRSQRLPVPFVLRDAWGVDAVLTHVTKLEKVVRLYSFRRILAVQVPDIWLDATSALVMRTRLGLRRLLHRGSGGSASICAVLKTTQEAVFLLVDGLSYRGWSTVFFDLQCVIELLARSGRVTLLDVREALQGGRQVLQLNG